MKRMEDKTLPKQSKGKRSKTKSKKRIKYNASSQDKNQWLSDYTQLKIEFLSKKFHHYDDVREQRNVESVIKWKIEN